jgi:hypothetical protein
VRQVRRCGAFSPHLFHPRRQPQDQRGQAGLVVAEETKREPMSSQFGGNRASFADTVTHLAGTCDLVLENLKDETAEMEIRGQS